MYTYLTKLNPYINVEYDIIQKNLILVNKEQHFCFEK